MSQAMRALEIYRQHGLLELASRIRARLFDYPLTLVLVVYRIYDVLTGTCVDRCLSLTTRSLYKVTPKTDGLSSYLFWFDFNSPHRRRRIPGVYEKPVMDVLASEVDSDSTFWEVGSGWGYHSMALASEVDVVTCFDADEDRIALLQKSIDANGYENVRIVDEYVDSLDDFTEDGFPDLVLMDIEGFEFSVLPDSPEVLQHGPLWVIEVHKQKDPIENLPDPEDRLETITLTFEQYGYETETISERGALTRLGREKSDETFTYHVVAHPPGS